MKDRETRIDEQISIYRAHSSSKALSKAKKDYDRWNKYSNRATIFGPLFLTILYAINPFATEKVVCWRNVINIVLTCAIVIILLLLHHKVLFFTEVVKKIELSKEQKNIENEELVAENSLLLAYHSFSINAVRALAEKLQKEQIDLAACSEIIVSCLYNSLLMLFDNDYITINIYELRDRTVRMIDTFTPSQYAEKKREIENPLLYINRFEGISIDDERIKEYYCIRILKGEVGGKDKKYILPDWLSILKEFKCDKWTAEEKEEIIKSKTRKVCLNSGFLYNQYIGIEFIPKEDVIGFLEIIPMKKAKLCSEDIDSIATEIKDSFIPLLNVIWTVSAMSRKG